MTESTVSLAAQRIALVGNTCWYLYKFRANTIRALRARGAQVICIAPTDAASINLTGMVVFSLETGLDIGLDLKGNVTSGVQYTNGEIKAVLLPIVIKIRKKILD